MRKILIPLALTALLAAGVIGLRREAPRWTSSSPQAIAELEAGLEAFHKLYFREAHARLEAALALDPELALARVLRLRFLEPEERIEARAAIDQIDLDTLRRRESLHVRYELAMFDKRLDDAARILDEYAAAFPDDPHGLFMRGERAWLEQDWEAAERFYRELIENHPNWVRAQNYLGYIEMARGNFAAAEDHFRTYMFIAPDQANPYDSLGELLILLGREREAEEMLEKALEIRPDFCASYARLLDLRLLQNRMGEVAPILARVDAHCGDMHNLSHQLRCRSRIWATYDAGDLEAAWDLLDGECSERNSGDIELIRHRVALVTGREEAAAVIEAGLGKQLETAETAPHHYSDFARAALAHMEGVRAGVVGDFDRAADAFQQSDGFLRYWAARDGTGIFKLYNQLNLVRALELAGREDEAAVMLSHVAEINPTLATRYGEMRLWFADPG